MNSAKLPDGPKGNILLRSRKELQNNVLGLIEKLTLNYPDISRLKIGPYYYVNVVHPDYIEHILTDSDLYVKGRENGNLKFLLGEGLLTNKGDFWMKQRRLIQPVFHKRRLATFVDQIVGCTERLMADWQSRGDGIMDIHAEMTQITLSVVSRTLLSTDASGDFMRISNALAYLMKGLSKQTTNLIRLPYWVPTLFNIRMRSNREMLDKLIYDIIAQRRNNNSTNSQQDDLLTMLMEVQDADTAERMTDTQLRDEVITIFLAGHETTANAMSFALYLMAKHPESARRIAAEVTEVIGAGPMTFENLNKLDYTTRVIKETMRLYPPAWIITREATKDDMVGGYLVKKGDSMLMFPYLTQRIEKYWPDPLKFDPDRFLPENMKDKPRYAYFPFGGGSRLCIGNNFAMMEMQIMLAMICSRFDFQVPADFQLNLEALVTLRPKGALPLKVTKK